MRKGRRFTPARLTKWSDQGRGTGTGANYQPWHQITRDDPGSRGRSHILNWTFGRLHHLLSDLELVAFGFATMVPDLVDLREQFPLSPDPHSPDVADYREDLAYEQAAGTLDVARELGFKHPIIRKDGVRQDWVMTTDLVLTVEPPGREVSLLAISVKHHDELGKRRTRELLAIERAYWLQQGVDWLLLTPQLYEASVGLVVRVGMHWATGHAQADAQALQACAALSSRLEGRSMDAALALISAHISVDTLSAQRIFWQSVWTGLLPLRMSWNLRPASPIALVAPEAFWGQNPITARRSAWKD